MQTILWRSTSKAVQASHLWPCEAKGTLLPFQGWLKVLQNNCAALAACRTHLTPHEELIQKLCVPLQMQFKCQACAMAGLGSFEHRPVYMCQRPRRSHALREPLHNINGGRPLGGIHSGACPEDAGCDWRRICWHLNAALALLSLLRVKQCPVITPPAAHGAQRVAKQGP